MNSVILSRDISRTEYTEGFFFLVCFIYLFFREKLGNLQLQWEQN